MLGVRVLKCVWVIFLLSSAVSFAAEKPRFKNQKFQIPKFDYQRNSQTTFLGFRPETDPARRFDPDQAERYLYSAHSDRTTWFRTANEKMLAHQYRERGVPMAQQVRDVLTYIPITISTDQE